MSIFQYLVHDEKLGTELRWVPNSQQSIIPQGAILGGHDEDGSPFYIIRADNRIGWYDPRETHAVHGKGRKYQTSNQWEFLVIYYREYTHTDDTQENMGLGEVSSRGRWLVTQYKWWPKGHINTHLADILNIIVCALIIYAMGSSNIPSPIYEKWVVSWPQAIHPYIKGPLDIQGCHFQVSLFSRGLLNPSCLRRKISYNLCHFYIT